MDCTGVVDAPQAAALEDKEAANNTVSVSDGSSPESEETPAGNVTDIYTSELNVTDLSANLTLADSELTKLDPNKTSEVEIKQTFCQEIKKVSAKFEVNFYLTFHVGTVHG